MVADIFTVTQKILSPRPVNQFVDKSCSRNIASVVPKLSLSCVYRYYRNFLTAVVVELHNVRILATNISIKKT
jgi:hypothetical protein